MPEVKAKPKMWWLRRDSHYLQVACLCFIWGLMLISYAGRWSWLRLQLPPPQHLATIKAETDDDIYTGSILYVPPRGDDCRLRSLDNHTNRVSERGAISCNDALAKSAAREVEIAPTRIEAIRKGFRRGD